MSIAIDPVCGMEVETETARLVTDYKDQRYYFCGKGCKLDFEDDPETYLDPSYTPSMGEGEMSGGPAPAS